MNDSFEEKFAFAAPQFHDFDNPEAEDGIQDDYFGMLAAE